MKVQRHAAILRIVRSRRVPSQDALRAALVEEGYTVTQATLSRDVRELGLAKLVDGQGPYYAQPQETGVRPDFQQVLTALCVGMEGVGPFLVLKTVNGSAGAVAVALDQAAWEEIIGTLAGEDTLLVITRTDKARERVAGRLRTILGR